MRGGVGEEWGVRVRGGVVWDMVGPVAWEVTGGDKHTLGRFELGGGDMGREHIRKLIKHKHHNNNRKH